MHAGRQTGNLPLSLNLVSDAQEDDDAGDVVNGGILLLPALDRLLNNGLCRLLCRVVLVVRHDDVSGFFVSDELPDAVASQDDELVTLDEVHLEDLG